MKAKDNLRLDLASAYTMKARLYLNKAQKEIVDQILTGVRLYYNCTMYAMLNDMECTREVQSKTDPDQTVHYPDFKKAQNATWKKKLCDEHPIIGEVPAGALMGNNGCVGADLTKALGKRSVEYINKQIAYAKSVKADKSLSREEKKKKLEGVQVPHYYSQNHPRSSYTYQETCSKVQTTGNINVFKISLNKLGLCKVRGWNRNVWFDADGMKNFLDFCSENKRQRITVTISKDLCGDYKICFKLLNVYVPIKDIHGNAVGVDVGLKHIAVLSDGTKYERRRFKNKEEKYKLKIINRKLSRRQGWANEEFREAKKTDKELQVSNRYLKIKKKHEKLERKLKRKRDLYNHCVTHEIIEQHDALAVESLDIKGMQENKYLTYSLADAALGDVLSKLKYKAKWHKKELRAVEKKYPSSQICSECGYVNSKLTLNVRKWTCPNCGTAHDRDINAAKNLLSHAYNI